MKKRQINILIVLFPLFFFCTSLSVVRYRGSCRTIAESDTTRYAVVPLDSNLIYYLKEAKPSTLSDNEIKTVDLLIKGAIDNYNKNELIEIYKIRPLDQYKMQLVPFINSNGEHQVLVNALCEVYDKIAWRKQFIHVDDGGNCFFNLKINLITGKIYDIRVNGQL